jgi:hypothetical protein
MFAKADTQGPVEAARQEVKRLFVVEAELTEKRRQKLGGLTAAEEAAVDAVVDGGGVEGIAQRAIEVETEARVLTKGIEVCRSRRLAAIRHGNEVEAAELRKQAAGKTAEADGILRRAEPLLKKLSELQGIEYDPSILLAQRTGTWTDNLVTGAPIEECSPLEARGDLDAGFAVPRPLALRREARQLKARAQQVAAQEVRMDGSVTKASLQEIFGADELQDAGSITPAVHAVEAWAVGCEAKIATRPGLAGSPRHYKLVWRDGRIDPEQSSVTVMTQNYSANQPVFTAE